MFSPYVGLTDRHCHMIDKTILPAGIDDHLPRGNSLGDLILHKNMPQAFAEDQGAVDSRRPHFMI